VSTDCYTPQRSLHYEEKELIGVRTAPLPRHVAIIMDGNRRWMRKQFLGKGGNLLDGHWAGANVVTKIVEAASDLRLKTLTVYGFSTENWGRSREEVNTLLYILKNYLDSNRQKMVEEGVRFHTIGDLSPFSSELRKTVELTSQATAQGNGIDFVVALNYGGRDEMRRVMQKIGQKIQSGEIYPEEITEEMIANLLDTAPFGYPDLLIRTSGEKRISNFLLWQLAYTEVHITETLWPDFTPRDLLMAVLDFQKRQRRIGK
jgi:undecaprenyl diphosphate synthase